MQLIDTPGGETLVVLTLDEFETLRDAADHARALASVEAGEETLSKDEVKQLIMARTPLAFWRNKRDVTRTTLAETARISEAI